MLRPTKQRLSQLKTICRRYNEFISINLIGRWALFGAVIGLFLQSRITLRNLLLCTGFMGAGLGCAGIASRGESIGISEFLLFLAAGPLIVAGLFAPTGRWRLGMYVGFFGQLVLWFGWALIHHGWNGIWR
jgi:hypothetical protein